MCFVRNLVDIFVLDLFLMKVTYVYVVLGLFKMQSKELLSICQSICLFLEDFCVGNPCKNGGKCDNNIDGNGYECFCQSHYRGTNCEISIFDGRLFELV